MRFYELKNVRELKKLLKKFYRRISKNYLLYHQKIYVAFNVTFKMITVHLTKLVEHTKNQIFFK